MDPTLKSFISALSKEKDLDLDIIKEAIEQAILSVSKKNLSQFRDARPELDMDNGSLTVYVTKTVVPDGEVDNPRWQLGLKEARKLHRKEMLHLPEEAKKLVPGIDVEVEIEPADFGRIAAQSAKQIVAQRLRDAERKRIFDEYITRVGQLVTSVVQRFERRDVIMNLGRAEGVMPLREQPMGARYKFGDRLKVLITDVRETPKGPLITLSRKSPDLVIRLFEQEVPEISEGIVKIIGVAREAGVRTKIAVTSSSSDVDPVGACVGMKGSRVQMVVRELENERIDIVPFSANAQSFIGSALNPAKIQEIILHEEEKRAEVVVASGNLAIAIGRKGQNIKLAARLTGWSLDIRSEEEEGLEYEEAQLRYLEDFLNQISGMTSLGRDALLKSQYNSVEKIAKAEPGALVAFTNDDLTLAERLVRGAGEYLEALRELQAEGRLGLVTREGEEEEGEAEAEEAGEAGKPEDEAKPQEDTAEDESKPQEDTAEDESKPEEEGKAEEDEPEASKTKDGPAAE
ncbi:MAG: transcription termination factor NusA [Candidatus Sumerlaeota bacterium]|nr:transcription termination factor NusA [Candidatus Sumerlaeota bacterium]